MLTTQVINNIFMNLLTALLYTFWFGIIVFVIFLVYMTFIAIVKEGRNTKSVKRKESLREQYNSLVYALPLIGLILYSLSKALKIF